jgi:putative RecB family exonuclease
VSKHEDGTLSPSRMDTYTGCALRYKYQYIDGLADPPGIAAVRGTLMHTVLEHVYNGTLGEPHLLPESQRTIMFDAYVDAMEPDETPVADEYGRAKLYLEIMDLWANYVAMEDPETVRKTVRNTEQKVTLDMGGWELRGIIDRVDEDVHGLTVNDYKTGKPPQHGREAQKLTGLITYAYLIWKTEGEIPRVKLLYLKNKLTITRKPSIRDLEAFERKAQAVRAGIMSGEYRAQVSYRCSFCPHRAICPDYIESCAERNAA